MRQHRRARGPAGVAAGLDLALEVIRMHVDDAGHQVVALEVGGAGHVAAPALDVADAGALEHDRAVDDLVGQDDAGVGQYGHAASCKGVTCNALSATASRTWGSWKMPASAMPRALA